VLTACGDITGGDIQPERNNISINIVGNVDDSVIREFVFLSQQIDIFDLPYRVQGAKIYGERIYYWYADSEGNIVVASVTHDGANRQSIQIPALGGVIEIGGLKIVDNGNIELVYSLTAGIGESTLIYGMYTEQGVEITSKDLSNIMPSDFEHIRLIEAVFTDEGYIALSVVVGEARHEILLLNSEKMLIGQLPVHRNDRISLLRYDRVVIWNQDSTDSTLREIDFDTGDFGDVLQLSVQNFRNLFCAGYDSEYDLLIFDGINIIGYELATVTATPLFNWVETNLGAAHEFDIGFLQSGQIFVIYSAIDTTGWNTELFILMRTSRDEIDDDYTVITLGGAWVSPEIRRFVATFNRNNQEYQIKILCYDTMFGWDAGTTRFNIDMIAGQGPDIIVGQSAESLEESLFLACLYSFIDTDPDISRNDFLPGIIKGLESRDGRLQVISNNFDIFLLSALSETMAQVGELTYENIIRWLSESQSRHLGPEWFNREWLVRESLLSFSDEFIDWENGIAHLDSDEFIDLLNIAYTLPPPEQFGFRREFDDLLNGNQLFDFGILYNVDSLRSGRRNVFGETELGEMIPAGVPSSAPGRHEFMTDIQTLAGINAGSEQPQTAWRFVRLLLLPESFTGRRGMPLRIDVLENLITASMTPSLVNGEEVPRTTPLGQRLYAMTDEDEAMLRAVIDNTTIRQRRNEILENIISEGLAQFFAGNATAEDAARIIQSRISIYLAERN